LFGFRAQLLFLDQDDERVTVQAEKPARHFLSSVIEDVHRGQADPGKHVTAKSTMQRFMVMPGARRRWSDSTIEGSLTAADRGTRGGRPRSTIQ